MANVSAQLFGNQEYINNLAQTNPSLFRKIYNEIKYLWHQFRGYKTQNQFIEDLQYKWEQAYRNNKELNDSTNYLLSKNARNEVNNIITETRAEAEKNTKQFIKLKDNTIKALVDYGINDYPMMARIGHIRENILTATEAKNLGYSTKGKHFHGVGVDTYLDIIDSMDNPLGVYQYTEKGKYDENNFIVLTPVQINGINAIVPVEINQRGQVNNVEIDLNRIKSVYSKDSNDYINNLLKDNKIKEIFNGSNSHQTSLINNSIPPIQENVNSNTTNYNMQESENNSGSFLLKEYNSIEDVPSFEKSKSNHRPNPRKGWDIERIQKQLKTESSERASAKELNKFENIDELIDNIFYHGSISAHERLKAGSTLKEEQRTGGYGEEYHTISLSKSKNIASNFASMGNEGTVMPVLLKKDSNVISMPNIEDSIELEEILPELWNKNVDAVKIGDWDIDSKGYGEQEIVILNPNCIATMGYDTTYFKNYGKPKFQNMTKEDISNSFNKYIDRAIENFEYQIEKVKQTDIDTSYLYKTKEDINKRISYLENQIQQYKDMYNKFSTTDNPDIRYSKNNENWQEYLDENIPSKGTKTNLQDIKLPTKQKILPTQEKTNNIKFDNEITKTDNELKGNVNTEEKVAKILTEPVEKVKEKNRAWAVLKANLIDKGMVFEELSRKAKNRELQGKYDYTLTANARGQYAIGNARYDGDTQISKSLTDIIDEVGENTGDFYNYMYHQLNVDRMTLEERYGGDTGVNYERKNEIKNKPVFGESVTAQMSKNEIANIEKKHPEFKKYAQDVYDYLDANKKELVDKGVISKETSDLFKEMYPHYVPIQRVGRNGNSINVPLDTGRTGINSPIKRAKGGSSDIAPLFETMADKTLQTYRASARNNFGVELKNTLAKQNQLNQISDTTDIDTIMDNITDEQQNNELLQEGKNGSNPTFTVFENGDKITFDISQDMYEALKPRDNSSILSKTFKIPNKISIFHRGVLTEYNPVFSITNAIKDAQDVLLNSQHSAKTYAKFPEAYAQILSKGHWYQEYVQNGGEQNSYFKDGQFDKPKTNLPTKAKNTLTFPLRAISNINNVIEMSPRLAEYIASRESGASIETAMLDASRVTTNFKAGGDVTKFANRNGATFLNASVQGFQQQVRNIQEANAKGLKGYAVLATKYTIAGVPALILNGLVWKDDEDYEKLQDYVKDNYYCVAKLPNGDFVRIPKGRVSATIQKIMSNASDFVKNDKINADEVGKEFWNDLKEDFKFAIDNVAPNNPIDNNILAPIVQVTQNKTWYGSDLVPSRLKDLPAEEQFDESTDKLSKWLGEKIGFSPYKINYLLNQYSGGIGDVLLPIGTPQAENNVIEDKFTANPILKNKYPGQFFEKVEELNVSNNSSKANDTDIIKYKYASERQKEISELYKEEREIQNSSDNDKVKKKKILDVQKKINKLAEDGLKDIEKIKVTGDTVKVNDTEYYKTTNLKDGTKEWKKISDEEKSKKKDISLKTYATYKEDIAKETIRQRKAGDIKEEGQLSDDSKIDILLSSKYSDKDKASIYENFILSKPKGDSLDTYKVIKSSGMDINEYLKFKQQEFVSDKQDDGTLNGKSVKTSDEGSAKNKFINYLNTMNITGNQRLLLFAMQGYKTTSSQKNQLTNYVQNLDIDKNTKLKLYNKFSGFKVYKDGTVKY